MVLATTPCDCLSMIDCMGSRGEIDLKCGAKWKGQLPVNLQTTIDRNCLTFNRTLPFNQADIQADIGLFAIGETYLYPLMY